MNSITVYLADDHALYREAVASVIQRCAKVGGVHGVGTTRELLCLFDQEIPDIVIADMDVPAMGGIRLCRKLAETYPEVKVIVLSGCAEKLSIYEALKSGACAVLPKASGLQDFEMALDTVMRGLAYSNACMKSAWQYGVALKEMFLCPGGCADFSKKETAIIELICGELTNRQISIELSISEHTVRNHKVRIMRKARVKSVQGLVKFAVINGLWLPG